MGDCRPKIIRTEICAILVPLSDDDELSEAEARR
jgi:hypothetical protein